MQTFFRSVMMAAMLAAALPSLAHDAAAPAPASSSLSVTGAVENVLTLRVDELRKYSTTQILTRPALHNAADGKFSEVKGVKLRDILEQAKIVKRDHNTVKKLAIIATATDGYKAVFSWNELFNSEAGDSVLVLFERDGNPLSAEEGPLALISAKDQNNGPRHVKWLQSIEVRQIVE